MDPVDAVLGGHRGRDAFVLDCTMQSPWAVQVADRAAVAVLAVLREHVTVRSAREPVTLGPGDLMAVNRAEPYVLADGAATPPGAVIEPGQVCRSLGVDFTLGPGPRAWGNDPTGSTRFVVGVYELPGQISGRLLSGLPDFIVVRAGSPARGVTDGLVELLAAESGPDRPGQGAVLDRLVDLVLITALRAGADASWWRGSADPPVRIALERMHDRPAEAWTLASLAAEASVSRATLARRFTDSVGEAPMRYLTRWRLAVAADLLAESDASVERIAQDVGYANAFGFSTAFKREYGCAPRAYRRESRLQLA